MRRDGDDDPVGPPGGCPPLSMCLVEDHEEVRTQLTDLLNANGCDVVASAGTVSSGEQLVVELHPQVAVVDGRLPDGEGLALCARLRSVAPDVPLILYTAQISAEEERVARLLGVAAVVLKSLRMGELLDAVRCHARRDVGERDVGEEENWSTS
ncbi:MAG TPA: response regulator transcription factor [Acidimicrobiales bacterium]|nr:response regulator transcription factor [Acidimicrobiales bacterium]